MSIEGIPEGWELVRVGKPTIGEYMVSYKGRPTEIDDEYCGLDAVIIRKIEKPKRFRAFENAAEYMPNWGKPVDWKLNDVSPCNCAVVSANVSFVWVAFGEVVQRFDWEQAFEKIWFADGTPFGVEVTE